MTAPAVGGAPSGLVVEPLGGPTPAGGRLTPGPGAALRVPLDSSRLARESRAIWVVLRREGIRFSNDRVRVLVGVLQPILFLFVLGSGLGTLVHLGPTINLRTFLYPGAAAMSVLFTALFSAGSVVWDREFGFLREMLVAPVSRTSLVIGKCFGGALVASVQGVLMIAIAGLAGVPYNGWLMLTIFGELLLLALTITSFGMVVAARIQSFQAFMAVTNMLVMPLFFLSGAMYPLAGLPTWMRVLTRIDPLTYAVDPIRRAVFAHLNVSSAIRARLAPGVSWNGWHVPLGLEIAVVAVMACLFVTVASLEFRKVD